MSGIDDSSGLGPLTPQVKKEYEEEYKHGADLFLRALNEYSKSDNMFQREEFKGVMEKAMQVLNDTARGLHRQELETQNKKIENDYATFQDQESPEAKAKLTQDLTKAKKTV